MLDAQDAPQSHTTPNSSIQKSTLPNVFQTPMKPESTASLAQSRMIPLEVRPNRPEFMKALKFDLHNGCVKPARDILEWLFAACIGKSEEVPAAVETKERFQRALDRARLIANEEDGGLKENLSELIDALESGPEGVEKNMYGPLVKVFNAAFIKLSKVHLDGLNDSTLLPIAINHSQRSPGYKANDECKPDIVFVGAKEVLQETETFEEVAQDKRCAEPWAGRHFAWHELFSTVEVKHRALSDDQRAAKMETLNAQYGEAVLTDCKLDPMQRATPFEPSTPVSESSEALALSPMASRSSSRVRTERPDIPIHSFRHPITGCVKREMHTSSSQSRSTRAKRGPDGVGSESGPDAKRIKLDAIVIAPPFDHTAVKNDARIQTAMYAAHMLSSSPDKTHSIAMTIAGTEMSLGWYDRTGPIESYSFDIIDNLPYFLLLLLILQRFQGVHWGYYSTGEDSPLKVWRHARQDQLFILELSADDLRKKGETKKTSFYIFLHHLIHSAVSLCSRGTNVFGARDTEPVVEPMTSTKELENGNDLVMKVSWRDVARPSEAGILKLAEELGNLISLIKGHIPEMVAYVDGPGWSANTGTIRKFLNKGNDKVEGARAMKIMILRKLVPIRELDPDHMFKAYIEAMFCHRALWRAGIRHGDISSANLMYDPIRKKGVLNDFDLSKLVAQKAPTGQNEVTGTLPFMSLDLLNDQGMKGHVAPLYRHEAESFAWVFIYLCYAVKKIDDKFAVDVPIPIKDWFSTTPKTIRGSKEDLDNYFNTDSLQPQLHSKYAHLAHRLYDFWTMRYHGRKWAIIRFNQPRTAEQRGLGLKRRRVQVQAQPYEEESEEDIWEDIIDVHLRELGDNERKIVEGLWVTYTGLPWKDAIAMVNKYDTDMKSKSRLQ